jgi:GNAT superfamily N-acetyltransferase
MTDANDTRYEVRVREDSATSLYVELGLRGRCVGMAECTSRSRYEWEFSHVEIEPPFRRKGLATKLVKMVTDRLRKRGVRRLYGSVMPDALAGFPGIVQWYEGLGFKRGEAYPHCIAGAAAYIRLDLQKCRVGTVKLNPPIGMPKSIRGGFRCALTHPTG